MTRFNDDLPPDVLHGGDLQSYVELMERLEGERPLMAPTARGRIRRRVAGIAAERRPRRLALLVASFACSGSACLVAAALGIS
jgi:hypothetical protein